MGPPDTAFSTFGDSAVVQRRAQRHVTPTKALGDGHDVGHHAVVLQGAPRAASAGTAHHLVGDHQHAMAVAHLAHQTRVAVRCRHDSPGRADHRFEDERRDVRRTEAKYLGLQFRRAPSRDIGGVDPVRRAEGVGG
jgi:hypothetical protein